MASIFHFPPFRLDERAGALFIEDRLLALRPKTFAVLNYLVSHAGRLVGKQELLSQIWPDVVIGEAALTVCVHELRSLLDDDSQSPRFIETNYGRGYRFVASVSCEHPPEIDAFRELGGQGEGPIFVGRQPELTVLSKALDSALGGVRQMLLVKGEPGVGKTTLIERFIAGIDNSVGVIIGRGQCVERYGETEAYFLLLDALKNICLADDGADLRQILRRQAPSWVVEIPGLIEASEIEGVRIAAAFTTQGRMFRELAEVLELQAATRPVLLVLEDLHLSDRSTIQFLDYLLERQSEARLLVLATARTGEAGVRAELLSAAARKFQRHSEYHEFQLETLNKSAVAKYIRMRIRKQSVPLELLDYVYRRTEGNALFVATVVDHLIARDKTPTGRGQIALDNDDVPDTARQMIERQIDSLAPADQRLLETASVAGVEFSPAELAGAPETQGDITALEERCMQVARQGRFLRKQDLQIWPDCTVASRYAFRHALYQEVLYARVGFDRRVRIHQAIGERIEAGYGARASEVAPKLAMHFELSNDCHRAARYLEASAQMALQRSANDAAIQQAEKALVQIASLPSDGDTLQAQLRLQLVLGTALMARYGMAAPRVEQVYMRAQELVEQIGERPAIVPVLLGMAKFHIVRSELGQAQGLVKSCMRFAQSAQDVGLMLEAHVTYAAVLYSRGRFRDSLRHSEHAWQLYDPDSHRSHALLYGIEPGVLSLIYGAMSLWRLGFADQARKRCGEAIALAEKQGHAHTLSQALTALVSLHRACRDWPAAEAWARKLLSHATEKELSYWQAWGEMLLGRAQLEQGGMEEGKTLIGSGLSALRATGGSTRQAEIANLLAQVKVGAVSTEQALRIARSALDTIHRNGELIDEAELLRTIGVLKLMQPGKQAKARIDLREEAAVQAERYFLDALEVARRQEALAFELRAAMELARLWMKRGKRAKGLAMLTGVYGRFSEGFDTGDLKEASALIEELN